jgi:sugar phosphate isomerase/epimerase
VYKKDNIDIPHIKQLIQDYHLEIPVVSTGQMYTMLNVWFTHPDRTIRAQAVEGFKGIIELASEFGADINVSRVRGYIHDEDSHEEGLARLTDCLEELCRYAATFGLNLVLEQMNRFETNYLCSVADVGEYLKTVGIPNLKIHADTFHMNIEDVNLPKTLEKYGTLLGYIHFSDSNRLAPGQGNIDFPAIIKTLQEIDYAGWIGIEVLTQPSPYEAAKQSIEYLRNYL